MSLDHPFAQRLLDAGQLAPKAASTARATWSASTAGDERAARYAAAALDGECRNVANAPEGQRNHILNRASYALGGYVAEGHLDGQLVIDRLTEAALAAGLDLAEINRTVPRAAQDGSRAPRTIVLGDDLGVGPAFTLDRLGDGDGGNSEGPARYSDAWALEHLPALDWAALWADDTDDEWIAEPILPAGRLIVLYSPPKAGKSLLALELAAGLAAGREVLGNPTRPTVTVYVDCENNPRGDTRQRLQDMGFGPADLGNLKMLSFPTLAPLDTYQGGRELIAAVNAYRAEVVIIDTVSRTVEGEENSNDTWLNFYRHTGMKLKAAGVAVIRLDHSGKDETKGMRGGSAKLGDVDAVWKLSAIDDHHIRLTCEASRMQVDPKELVLERQSHPLRHIVVGLADRMRSRAIDAHGLAAQLAGLGAPVDISRRTATTLLRNAAIKFSNDRLIEALKIHKNSVSVWDEAAQKAARTVSGHS